MSSSNCCFLTCIKVSQEAGQVVWYSHLLKNFPPFVVIHTVKGFGIVKKEEVDVFLEFSCFFDDPVSTSVIFRLSCVSESSRYLGKTQRLRPISPSMRLIFVFFMMSPVADEHWTNPFHFFSLLRKRATLDCLLGAVISLFAQEYA